MIKAQAEVRKVGKSSFGRSLTIYFVFYQIKIKGRTGEVVFLFVDEHFK